jgi:hypothetical protein
MAAEMRLSVFIALAPYTRAIAATGGPVPLCSKRIILRFNLTIIFYYP